MAKDKLSKGQRNFVNKFINPDGKLSEETMVTRSNRFSGEEAELNQVAAACHDFVMKVEDGMNRRSEAILKAIHPELKLSNAVQKFDMARMTVLAFSREAYSTLLD